MNQVVLYGRLSADPQVFVTPKGTKGVRFNVVVEKPYKSEGSTADFIQCTAWNKSADTIEKFFHKGSPILVSGHSSTGSYTNKDGKKVFTMTVFVDHFWFSMSPKLKSEEDGTAVTESAPTRPQEGAVLNPSQDFVPMESDMEIPFE